MYEIMSKEGEKGKAQDNKHLKDKDFLSSTRVVPNNTGLPEKIKSGVEGISGYSLDDIKVHYNSAKPSQLQALAYTQDRDIYVAPGQEKHLPHEAWHIVQQKQGRVRPTVQIGSVGVNDDAGLEKEADIMGSRAVQAFGGGGANNVSKVENVQQSSNIVQKVGDSSVVNSFEDFSQILEAKIKSHIDNAVLDDDLEGIAIERELFFRFEAPDLFEVIKHKFSKTKNIKLIISKVLAANTPGVSDPDMPSSVDNVYESYLKTGFFKSHKINSRVISAFNSLKQQVQETLNDIYNWTAKDGAVDIKSIDLTDSDIHTRGVGVCIVEYQNAFKSKKLVIKPEDKSFEKAVYGKEPDSLANQFNRLMAQGMLGEEFKGSKIGTLDIQTSEGNAHGSAVEFFEHQQLEEISDKGKINSLSSEGLVAFASLLGLGDLHKENAVYSKTENPVMQLIDAEIGMKFAFDDKISPLTTAMEKGEMQGFTPSIDKEIIKKEDFEKYNIELVSNFLEQVKSKFKNLESRLVVLPTQSLFMYRKFFLAGDLRQEIKDGYWDELEKAVKGYFPENIISVVMILGKEGCLGLAENDFSQGRIPYFKLAFKDGGVFQESGGGSVKIAEFKGTGGAGFLDAMINNRKEELYDNIVKKY